jgi:hypothetical protein
MDTAHLVNLAECYRAHRKLTLITVSSYAARDGKYFDGLKKGRGCTIRRYNALLRWFSDNWPADLAWPADIPRPTPKKEAA